MPIRNWKRIGTWLWLIEFLFGLWPVFGAERWQNGSGFRFRSLPVPASGKTGFTELTSQQTGVAFTNILGRTNAALNQILLNGSGVAAGDVDGDGWCDVYFCRLEGPNALYRNRGDWTFEDITAAAGVACDGQFSTGAALVDLEGDGDRDLLVNSVGGGTRCFLNDGKGHFTEAQNSGLVRQLGSTSMALADIDGDGDLDLYVANYRTTTIRSTGFELLNVNGQRMLRPEDRDRLYVTPDGFLREHGEVDAFYLHDGKGHFQQMSWTDGRFKDAKGNVLTAPPKDWALSVVFRDINRDGAPDLYVCNDFWSPDKIWLNDGQGNFREIAREALPNTSTFSMGMDFGDINRDGFDDFFVLDMFSPDHVRRVTQTIMFGNAPWPIGYSEDRPQVTRNTLFLNRGDNTFAEMAQMSGVQATDWSWSPVFLDVDLDGFEDLLVVTGNTFDTQDQDAENRIRAAGPWPRVKVPYKLWMYPSLFLPNVAFRNRGDLTFEETGKAWGFHAGGVSQGMCLADLDNDGDLDVVLNNLNAAASLCRNESIRPRIAIRLLGGMGNRAGIGARIQVSGGPVDVQSQEMIAGGRYLSCDDALRVFAAGHLTNQLRITVLWRGGGQNVVTDATANHLYEIAESAAARPAAPKSTPRRVHFEDVSDRLNHVHHQEPFDDFARQPLLPNKLSQLGPNVAWTDLDNDGWEDLVIGGSRGGKLAFLRNDGRGGFSPIDRAPFNATINRSLTTVLGWHPIPGKTALVAGAENYETASAEGASVHHFDYTGGDVVDNLPGQPSSTGPMALADVDGDGDLDLFVGGRVVPGRYPEPASSRLFRNDRGFFKLAVEESRTWDRVGMVSGVVFSDLDGDGDPDLVLACEWGAVRVCQNDQGKFQDVTDKLGLGRYLGWWNGVTVGDFDGDGRLDIAASNWGRNTKYEAFRSQPLRLFYGDFNEAGQVDIVEAHFDAGMGKMVPDRAFESMANALPFLRERFATHKAYGQAGLTEVLGDRLKSARELAANILESMVFLNRDNHFESRVLPVEAQLAPAFGLCTGDMDGDGCEDLFLSQNFFATQPMNSPYDGGRGLWLKGDGRGGFRAVPGQESGIRVYGEQRGAALCDYDSDGRVDLAVAQNGAATRLYHNVGAKPGLRVRLKGSPGNPDGVGAVMSLLFGKRRGPVREIHAGSGYWSQDSAVQVMGAPEQASQIWIRWPGGRTTTTPIPPNTRQVTIDPEGKAILP